MDNNLVVAICALILVLAVLPMVLMRGQFGRKDGDSTSSTFVDRTPDGGDGGGGGE